MRIRLEKLSVPTEPKSNNKRDL